MKKSKKLLVTILFMIVFIIANSILNFSLVPPGLTRVILHEVDAVEDYQCIVLGTSHGSYGIDPEIVSEQSGLKTMNLCIGGEYMQDSYYLLKHVFETNTPELIVLDVDFQYLINVPKDSVAANFIYNAYPFSLNKFSYFKDKILGMEFRAAVFPWLDYRNNYSSAIDIMKMKFSEPYKEYSAAAVTMEAVDEYRGNGFIYRNTSNGLKTDTLGSMQWDSASVDTESIEYLSKIIELCRKNNAKIIMTTVPISTMTIQNSSEEYAKAYAYVAALAESDNVNYYNFSLLKQDVFERSIEDYWDYDGHMYGSAAQRFSAVFGRFLEDFSNGRLDVNRYLYDSVLEIN